jgi:hypothetical protein
MHSQIIGELAAFAFEGTQAIGDPPDGKALVWGSFPSASRARSCHVANVLSHRHISIFGSSTSSSVPNYPALSMCASVGSVASRPLLS